ncbi:MAG: MerR family transcriptional regulator [Gammaproteobacteria bacterium RIFCSPHIGHO2_12_FULL_41_15]|nr:MAG: MerR family transcriptional regulator [Gammaproteobacteria bacterium RIFCSPHIGHO2_12_FULL_41_15]
MSNQKSKVSKSSRKELPPIPDKLYFTIGEVSRLCDLRPHVLRYWEQEFPQLTPNKRRGNRRYYQRKEVLLVRQIKSLLYDQGYTIEGARLQLSSETQEGIANLTAASTNMRDVVTDLENVLTQLEEA